MPSLTDLVDVVIGVDTHVHTHSAAAVDYTARRTAEGKTSREIKRCLKRYIAHDPYRLLENSPEPLDRP